MITQTFDDRSEAIISPGSFSPVQQFYFDTAIATFSMKLFEYVKENLPWQEVACLRAANHTKPILLVENKGTRFLFYLSEIGSTLCATDIIEVNWLAGATKFIVFGSAGALDKEKTVGKYIIPTEAYRDEGMSYHYAKASDYIKVKNADFVTDFFEKNHLPCVSGRVWTTDGFYRETRNNVEKRKADGCIAVEMEIAGMQAVCDFHGFELYDFLETGDIVDQPDYTPEGLHEANHSLNKLFIAMELAKTISGSKP